MISRRGVLLGLLALPFAAKLPLPAAPVAADVRAARAVLRLANPASAMNAMLKEVYGPSLAEEQGLGAKLLWKLRRNR